MDPRRTLRILALWGALQWLAAAGLWVWSWDPARAERWTAGPGNAVAHGLASLSGLAPFALGEGMYATLGLVVLGWLASCAWRARAWGSVGKAVLWGLAELSVLGSAALVAFQVTFGMAYARPRLADRIGLVLPDPAADPAAAYVELHALTAALVDRANAAYRRAHGTDDLGRPTEMDRVALDAAIDRGYAALPARYGFEPGVARARPPTRRMMAVSPVPAFGVAGFYVPFTGEAMTDSAIPDFYEGFVMAHEKAHQHWIAPEDEADFVGFLAALHSGDAYGEYCAWVEGSTKALLHLARADPAAAQALAATFVPGIQRDLGAADAYFSASPSFTRSFGAAVNDAYLRANAQEHGIDSYRRSFELIVAWARVHLDPVDRD